ncbi:MAG: NAD(P)-dependent oxidoreductase [Asgard group archaeon]|nr:NAD(P)-dependent oxidoreductase [Asgard group archaeon]
MTILVTGATGFLGGVLVRQLIENENILPKDIRFLVRDFEDYKDLVDLGVIPFIGDLGDPESLKGITEDITTVYHNAAIVINESVTTDVMMKINYQGTIALVEDFMKSKTTEKFVFASSFGVYGMKFPKYPIKEDYQKNPANAYQLSKWKCEEYLQEKFLENGLDYTAIRNSLIVGPRDNLTSYRVCLGLIDKKIPYLGKGKNEFSMVDARDSSQAMIKATKESISKGKAYNIKSFDINQRDYFNYYSEACKIPYPEKKYPYWLAYLFAWFKEKTTPKDQEVLITRTRIDRYCNYRMFNTERIAQELKFDPIHTDSKKVITESVDWLFENNYLKLT